MGDAVLLAVAVAAAASVACLVVPFVTIWRLTSLQRQVAALAARLEALEPGNAPNVPQRTAAVSAARGSSESLPRPTTAPEAGAAPPVPSLSV